MALRQLASSLRRLGGNQRQLQEELDTHKLFLLTSFQKASAAGMDMDAVEKLGRDIERRAESLSFKEQRREVHKNVHQQLRGMLRILHGIFSGSPSSATSGGVANGSVYPDLRSTAGQATDGSQAHSSSAGDIDERDFNSHSALTWAEVSAKFGSRVGFTLDTGPSTVPHPDAGNGLFVKGKASPGQVVAIYPGAVFPPSRYRYIPGYPKIDASNSLLIARFDGAVIDGREWTTGLDERCFWGNALASEHVNENPKNPATSHEASDDFRNEKPAAEPQSGLPAWLRGLWETFGDEKPQRVKADEVWARTGALIEFRNPLAMAHFANHPGEMQASNVMVCSYDFPSDVESELRPYVPNIMVGGEDLTRTLEQVEGMEWPSPASETKVSTASGELRGGGGGTVVQTLVFVATKCIEDEEVLLNYRLSPHVKRPEWYKPVDDDEDKRRWG